jgi:hypothetical protein
MSDERLQGVTANSFDAFPDVVAKAAELNAARK